MMYLNPLEHLMLFTFFLGLVMCTEGLAVYTMMHPVGGRPPYRPVFLEYLLELTVVLALLFAFQMLIDLPGMDLPDIKDIGWLFLNLGP